MRRGCGEGLLFQHLVTVTTLLAWLAVLRDRDTCERIGDGVGRGWVGLLVSLMLEERWLHDVTVLTMPVRYSRSVSAHHLLNPCLPGTRSDGYARFGVT